MTATQLKTNMKGTHYQFPVKYSTAGLKPICVANGSKSIQLVAFALSSDTEQVLEFKSDSNDLFPFICPAGAGLSKDNLEVQTGDGEGLNLYIPSSSNVYGWIHYLVEG